MLTGQPEFLTQLDDSIRIVLYMSFPDFPPQDHTPNLSNAERRGALEIDLQRKVSFLAQAKAQQEIQQRVLSLKSQALDAVDSAILSSETHSEIDAELEAMRNEIGSWELVIEHLTADISDLNTQISALAIDQIHQKSLRPNPSDTP